MIRDTLRSPGGHGTLYACRPTPTESIIVMIGCQNRSHITFTPHQLSLIRAVHKATASITREIEHSAMAYLVTWMRLQPGFFLATQFLLE